MQQVLGFVFCWILLNPGKNETCTIIKGKIMKPIQIADDIYWTGAIDWNLRNFHGYLTQKGSTYNSYLIIDDEITLVDTVKSYLAGDSLARISSIIDPSKIKRIIVNHVEMDHTGALPLLLEHSPGAEVICSSKGEKGLIHHFGSDFTIRPVEDGESINTGKHTLTFRLTPMVHWPDNMVCYCPEKKLLFSNDAFGQHLATSERFEDQYHVDIVMQEARKYFANIVLPYAAQVKKALEALDGLEIGMIAPSHGLLWRSHVEAILEHYRNWSENRYTSRALIIYDTMWESTARMARSIQGVFEKEGYETRLLHLQNNHISDIMTEVLDAEYICVGSPTLNNDMLPTVASFLTYFRGLSPKNRKGLAFGSYGWGGQSIKNVHEFLASCKLNMLDPISVQYIPDATFITEMEKKLASEVRNRI